MVTAPTYDKVMDIAKISWSDKSVRKEYLSKLTQVVEFNGKKLVDYATAIKQECFGAVASLAMEDKELTQRYNQIMSVSGKALPLGNDRLVAAKRLRTVVKDALPALQGNITSYQNVMREFRASQKKLVSDNSEVIKALAKIGADDKSKEKVASAIESEISGVEAQASAIFKRITYAVDQYKETLDNGAEFHRKANDLFRKFETKIGPSLDAAFDGFMKAGNAIVAALEKKDWAKAQSLCSVMSQLQTTLKTLILTTKEMYKTLFNFSEFNKDATKTAEMAGWNKTVFGTYNLFIGSRVKKMEGENERFKIAYEKATGKNKELTLVYPEFILKGIK